MKILTFTKPPGSGKQKQGSLLKVLIGLIILFSVSTITMSDIVPGNPDCCDLKNIEGLHDDTPANDIGFKVNLAGTALNGTWTFVNGTHTEITCNSDNFAGSEDLYITFTIYGPDGSMLDWVSNIPIDAIIMKGGNQGSNVYYYDPEVSSGTGLHPPENLNGGYPQISHVEVCFDIDLTVTKTAETGYIRTFPWDIQKTVSPATWDFFPGDDGTSEYTVTIIKEDPIDSDWVISGDIVITNPSPFDATITAIIDEVSGGIFPTVSPVTFPLLLAPGATFTCTYNSALPDGSQRLNTATAVVEPGTMVGGGSGTADVIFGDPTTLVNDQVQVTDTWNGSLGGPFSETTIVTYLRTFTCADEGFNHNTATIIETEQSASASVEVICHSLDVTKTASTSFTREYTWALDKSGSNESLTLAPGQVYTMTYYVDVSASYTDYNHAVTGTVTVYNPAPIAATINSVTDMISPDMLAVALDCGLSFPFVLDAGASLSCTYSADLIDATLRTNTATATLQNYSYDKLLNATPNGTSEYSGSTSVDFTDASIEHIDECIDLSDNMLTPPGFLGEVCFDDLPYIASYNVDLGPYGDPEDCGYFEVENIASYLSCDDGDIGNSTFILNVYVACESTGGCTLTLGYWKTHSIYGPAPYDDNWATLGDADGDGILEEEDETFFLSGQTYYEVLWTPPAGNVYYVLAPQYIAAELNFLNGADPTEAQEAFDNATALLIGTDPDDCYKLKGQAKKAWTTPAAVLDDYNNGLIGPGHCDDNDPEYQSEEFIDLEDNGVAEQDGYALMQNFPNPFDNATKFGISLPVSTRIEINIYSLTGQKVVTVFSGTLDEGSHIFNYNLPSGMSPGIYIYSLESSEITLFRKMNIH